MAEYRCIVSGAEYRVSYREISVSLQGSKDTYKAAVLDDISVIIVGRIPLIFSLIETILLVKNLMKSFMLRVKGIHG